MSERSFPLPAILFTSEAVAGLVDHALQSAGGEPLADKAGHAASSSGDGIGRLNDRWRARNAFSASSRLWISRSASSGHLATALSQHDAGISVVPQTYCWTDCFSRSMTLPIFSYVRPFAFLCCNSATAIAA